MSGLTTHSGLALADLNTHRGLASLASIDGMALSVSPGTPESVEVSGAGSSGIDGTYDFLGTYLGRPWYKKPASGGGEGDAYVWFDYQWRISFAPAWPTIGSWMYRNEATDMVPPKTGWLVDSDGMGPAPTLIY